MRLPPEGIAREAYFWATQGEAELDLLLFENGRRIGYEFKYSENPKITRSMRTAISDLKLDELRIICPGSLRVELEANIQLYGLGALVH